MSKPLPLSIVMVNWNGVALLPACLGSLEPTGAEVIVVDNGSTDGSLALLDAEFGGVRVLGNASNTGFAVASNQGLRLATQPTVLFLNNDTIANQLALEALVSFLRERPEAGIVGPALAYPDGRPQASCGPGPNLWTELLGKSLLHRLLPGLRQKAPDRSCRVDWVTGAALCIRRDLALELGGFDEGMFMFYEDLDLCTRARERGQEIWFVATPPIVHLGGASRQRVEVRSLLDSYRSADRFFTRHGPRWRRTLLRGLTLPEMGLRSAVWAVRYLQPGTRDLARERLRAYREILRLAIARDPSDPEGAAPAP